MALKFPFTPSTVAVVGVSAANSSTCFLMSARASHTCVCAFSSSDSPHPAATAANNRSPARSTPRRRPAPRREKATGKSVHGSWDNSIVRSQSAHHPGVRCHETRGHRSCQLEANQSLVARGVERLLERLLVLIAERCPRLVRDHAPLCGDLQASISVWGCNLPQGCACSCLVRAGWDSSVMAQGIAAEQVRLGALTRRARPLGGGVRLFVSCLRLLLPSRT